MKYLEDKFIKFVMGVLSACIVAFICWVAATTFENSVAIAVMKPEVDSVYTLAKQHWGTQLTSIESDSTQATNAQLSN